MFEIPHALRNIVRWLISHFLRWILLNVIIGMMQHLYGLTQINFSIFKMKVLSMFNPFVCLLFSSSTLLVCTVRPKHNFKIPGITGLNIKKSRFFWKFRLNFCFHLASWKKRRISWCFIFSRLLISFVHVFSLLRENISTVLSQTFCKHNSRRKKTVRFFFEQKHGYSF